MNDLNKYIKEKGSIVEDALRQLFPEQEENNNPVVNLTKSMNYSLLAGGKRLRPILCIAGAEVVGGNADDVMPVACALELIHTYSLIHDDLPAMDDDSVRRGKPTNHVVYGEAMAILAGDGLLTEAFFLMSKTAVSDNVSPESLQKVLALIAGAAGYRGMVGGQVVDILSEGKVIDSSLVEYIHRHKTGALISASVLSGTILGGGTEEDVNSITTYGNFIGLAFQVADDILNIEGDSKEMGKDVGSDAERGKNTYPSVFGLAQSKEMLNNFVDQAIESIERFDEKADPLRMIARYIIERKK